MIPPGLGHPLMMWLVRNSTGAAVVALLVLAVQWMLGNRISARWRHNLWLLVMVRLVLPPPAAVRVPAIPHLALLRPLVRHFHGPVAAKSTAQNLAVTPAPHAPTAGAPEAQRLWDVMPAARTDPLIVSTVPASTPTRLLGQLAAEDVYPEHVDVLPVRQNSAAPGKPWPARVRSIRHAGKARFDPAPTRPSQQIPWARIATFTWCTVALTLLMKTLLGTVRIALAVRRLRPVHDPALVELLKDCCRLLNLAAAPALLEGPAESGPALVGFWRPKLLLPRCVTAQFTWREVRHVMLHELTHLKRRDILVNYFASLVQAVHWFNPLVWLAAARMRTEREMACDEAVLAYAPWREGRAYGSTIVKLLELLSRGAVPAGAMGAVGHKALMHRRIAMIARFDGSRRHWSASGLLLSAAVTGAALAGAVRAQVQPVQEQPAPPAATAPPEPKPAEAAAAIRSEAAREDPPAAAPAGVELAPPPAAVGAGPATIGAGPAAESGAGEAVTAAPPVASEPPPANVDAGVAPNPLPAPPADVVARPGVIARFVGGGRGGAAAAGAMPMGAPMMGRAGGFGGGGGTPVESQFATIEDAAAAKADARTLEKLQRLMPLQVDNEPLGDVLNMLAQKGGFDVLVDNRTLGEAGVDQNTAVQINIHEPQPIEQLLHFVLRQAGGDEVAFSLAHGVVMISTRMELARHMVTRVYDIGDLGNPDEVRQTLDQTIGDGVGVRFLKGKLIVTTSEPTQREVAKLLTLLRQDGPHADAAGAPAGSQNTSVFQFKHADAQLAAKGIQLRLGPGVKAVADRRTNSLTITGTDDALQGASVIVHEIDSAPPTVNPVQGR